MAHFVEQIKLAHNTLYKVETFLNGLKIYQVNGEKMWENNFVNEIGKKEHFKQNSKKYMLNKWTKKDI